MFDVESTQKSMDNNKQALESFLNPYCTEQCVNNLVEGRLQCNCADSGIYAWRWERQPDTCAALSKDNREIIFHPVYSSGTAALRGNAPFESNQHHFWEMKIISSLYGTDVMIGVGTDDITLTHWRYRFFSLLGCNSKSWGYSYNGAIQHDNAMKAYGSKFGLGSLIGVHLDMCSGTLEYYLNRKPLGVAFKGLKMQKLYPMICSTAAQSAMTMTFASSVDSSLQLACLQKIIKNPQLYSQFKNIPGLAKIYENKFFWILPKECEGAKRKLIDPKGALKRRKTIPIVTPIHYAPADPLLTLDYDDGDSDSV